MSGFQWMGSPSSVSISMRSECCCRPSMMCVAFTPCAKHRVQHSTLHGASMASTAAHAEAHKRVCRLNRACLHEQQTPHRSLLYNTAICKQCVCACRVHRQWLGIRTLCGVWGKASHLGIIPPAMIPSATSSRTCRISRDTNFVATSSLSLSTPGTSVMRISFSAFNEAAICMCN
jgi:hypothetical protein